MMRITEIFKTYGKKEINDSTGSICYVLKGQGLLCTEEDRYEVKELIYTSDEDPEEESFSIDIENVSYCISDLIITYQEERYIEITLPFGDELWFNF